MFLDLLLVRRNLAAEEKSTDFDTDILLKCSLILIKLEEKKLPVNKRGLEFSQRQNCMAILA
jgi:hypothetical protein